MPSWTHLLVGIAITALAIGLVAKKAGPPK